VLPTFRNKTRYNKSDIYRACIEKGILSKNQIAPTTFYRFVKKYELLKDEVSDNKKRLAFAMQYANHASVRSAQDSGRATPCMGRM
jgi:hypothetical protein